MRKTTVWIMVVSLLVGAIIAIDYYTGVNAVANLLRLAWNGVLYLWRFLLAFIVMLVDFIFQLLVRGIGWSRLTRPLSALMLGVGIGYLVTNKRWFTRSRGFKEKGRILLQRMKDLWSARTFLEKILISVALIATQVLLHAWIILFPVGFLITPTVKWLRNYVVNEAFGAWYWNTFGSVHRKVVMVLRSTPGVGSSIGGFRLVRLYFCGGWREWKYHFSKYGQVMGRVYLLRNIRRWGKYRERPLLSGHQEWPAYELPYDYWNEREQGAHPLAAILVILVCLVVILEYVTEGRVIGDWLQNLQ